MDTDWLALALAPDYVEFLPKYQRTVQIQPLNQLQQVSITLLLILSYVFCGIKYLEQWSLLVLPCQLELLHLFLYCQLLGALIHYPVDALAQLCLVDTTLLWGGVLSFPSDLPI